MPDEKTLNKILLFYDTTTFERKILEGITKLRNCSDVVEIMKASFGEHYNREMSPILNDQLKAMFELSIKDLLDNEKIMICKEFKNEAGVVNTFTRLYQIK